MFESRSGRIASITIMAFGLAECATAAPIEPLDVELSVQGAPVEAEGCTGGDWSLSWHGQVPGEGGPIDDMLISYSSFDTTHKEDRQGPPVSLTVKPVTCKDDQGNVAVSASIAGGDRLVRGVIALKNDPAAKAPFFIFEVSDAGTCSINFAGAMGQEFTEYLVALRSTDLMGLSPALRVDRTEMREGFEKHFKLSGQIIPLSPFCMGHKIVRGDLTLRYKRRDELPQLSLAGCANLPKGGATTIQANVSPVGGDLTFESVPADVLSVQPQASAARITGANPGRGQLKASYMYNGKTAAANLPASTVELVSINDGQPSAPMGLYGIDAKLSSKVYPIPIQTHPVDAGDLLIFVAENDAIVSVNTNRNSIGIQPVREGRTIIRAKTLCGEPVGPPMEIEVRTCDDEVQAELKRRQEIAMHREREIVKRITSLTADSEFQRAGKEVAEHTANMAVKTAEVIAATLTGSQAAAVRNGTATAATLRNVEMAQNVWDTSNVVKDANAGNINSSLLGAAVVTAGKWTLSSLKSFIEAGLAAQDLGQDLGTLVGFTEQLEQLTAQHDEARREVHEITRRLHICEKLPPPPPLPPKKDKPQPPPIQETEEPPPVDIPVEEVPTEQPQETPPQPPPGPPDPPRTPGSAGLCVRPVEEPLGSDDLREALASVNQFKTASQRAREIFEAFTASLQPVQQSLAQDQNAQIAAVKSMAGPFDNMVEQLFSMADVARAQEKRFELCTAKLPTQMEKIEATMPKATGQ
jgi:hypothetical protein